MSWVGAGDSDWATHCVTCPASRSGEITKVADHYFCLQDLHTVVQLLHSSGQLILVNALERSRFRLHLLLCGGTSSVEDIKYKDTGRNTLVQFARCELQLAGC